MRLVTSLNASLNEPPNRVIKYKVDLVAFHITAVCGHVCPFCYMSSIRAQRPQHPPFDRLLKVIDSLSEASVREVTFLGGDPSLYPKVVDLAKYCNKRGLIVSIISNTHRYPGSSVAEIAQYVTAFEATIHAPNAHEHDEFCRSKGAFDFVLSRLREAVTFGRKVGIAINVTPGSAHLIFDIAKAIKVGAAIPLDYIIVQRIIPFGRAQTTSQFTISREHAERSMYEIERIDEELGIKISVEDPFPLCVLPERLRKYMNPCEWGFTKASVNDKGDLSRCGADPRCRLGNILETPLLDIWNNSPVLSSFRQRGYLPGRCQTCVDLEQCGGGCPLSCEIEKDHGLDYLFLEYQRFDAAIHGELTFGNAREEELSSILQIEWSDFPGYGHIFSVSSLRQWYKHNPEMFYVLRDSKNWVMAYACLAPITHNLHGSIKRGKYVGLAEFPPAEVLSSMGSPYYHLEVVASVPARSSSRVGRLLIKKVGEEVAQKAKWVTASPITDIGVRLCKYFGFEEKSKNYHGKKAEYPIYLLRIKKRGLREKLRRF